jgi:hypothetical protein
MAAIFTPGLTVTPQHVVLKDRRLPLEGEVTVQLGDVVRADDVVARTALPGKVYPVNVANQLGIDPQRLTSHMLKGVGDRVRKDELIAKTDGFFGLFGSEATAIVTGTIESISTVTGMVIFQADPIPVEVDAYINGKVVEISESEGCIVQAQAALVQGIFGLGGEVKGELFTAVGSGRDELRPEHLNEQHRGKVIVGGCYADIAALKRAVEVGVAGIVIGGFDYDEIKELLGYEVGVAITGGEDLGLTLIVTEGFGRIEMAPATFKLLQSLEGRRASINGATQIRAGVIRPEVVVTHDDVDVPDSKFVPPEPKGIAEGDIVRGIRAPWFGKLGTVVGLPPEPTVMASETKVRVLEVEFEDGQRALLPRANVEHIEE